MVRTQLMKRLSPLAIPTCPRQQPFLPRLQAPSSFRYLHSKPSCFQQQYRYFPSGNFAQATNRGRRIPVTVYVAAGGGTVYYVYHLEKVEETGRRRFMDTSEDSERAMGHQATQQVLQEYKGKILPPSDPRSKQVNRVVHRLLKASGLEDHSSATLPTADLQNWGHAGRKRDLDWKVYVIDDKTANAFVLPNACVFVFSGILPICKNEDGLAVVLGHEISHQIARHSAERMSGQKVTTFIAFVLASLGLDFYSSSSALQLLMTLPNSRTQETEADLLGLRLAASACYDPNEAVPFWKRMGEAARQKGGSPPQFLSTHPADTTRIKNIEAQLPEVMQLKQSRCETAASFMNSPFQKATYAS